MHKNVRSPVLNVELNSDGLLIVSSLSTFAPAASIMAVSRIPLEPNGTLYRVVVSWVELKLDIVGENEWLIEEVGICFSAGDGDFHLV